jgi:hypothetical protein
MSCSGLGSPRHTSGCGDAHGLAPAGVPSQAQLSLDSDFLRIGRPPLCPEYSFRPRPEGSATRLFSAGAGRQSSRSPFGPGRQLLTPGRAGPKYNWWRWGGLPQQPEPPPAGAGPRAGRAARIQTDRLTGEETEASRVPKRAPAGAR